LLDTKATRQASYATLQHTSAAKSCCYTFYLDCISTPAVSSKQREARLSALRNSTANGDENLITVSLVLPLWILGSLALWSSLYPFWLVLHCENLVLHALTGVLQHVLLSCRSHLFGDTLAWRRKPYVRHTRLLHDSNQYTLEQVMCRCIKLWAPLDNALIEAEGAMMGSKDTLQSREPSP